MTTPHPPPPAVCTLKVGEVGSDSDDEGRWIDPGSVFLRSIALA